MADCAKLFQKFLDSKELKYSSRVASDGEIVIDFPYQGKVTTCIFSGDDHEYLSMYTVFERIPDNKRTDLILICNDLNTQYKWVTFYVDSDNDLVLHSDARLSLRDADEEAFEILVRSLKLSEDVKPVIMKAIYV